MRINCDSSCSGLSAGIAAIVVQFGFATMPLGIELKACGFTSLTTSGTAGSLRHALELSITTAPAAAKSGATARLVVAPAENNAKSIPEKSEAAVSSTTICLLPHITVLPADRD